MIVIAAVRGARASAARPTLRNRTTPRRWFTLIAAPVAVGAALLTVSDVQAASRSWHDCGRAATKAAADGAGVPAALDGDPRLRRVFGDERPSATFTSVHRAYCADFDGDGDLDRAALYVCCTASSPSPVVILRNDGASFAIAYKRLHASVTRIRRAGRALVVREPSYARSDPNCCPSRYLDRTLRWTGTRFASTVRIRRAERPR